MRAWTTCIEVLRQLTPKDAKLLDELMTPASRKRHRKVQPWVGSITWAERDRRIAAGEDPRESFENLIRLGLIATEYELDKSKITVGVRRSDNAVKVVDAKLDSDDYLTDFVMRFVQACRAPAVTIEGQTTEAKQKRVRPFSRFSRRGLPNRRHPSTPLHAAVGRIFI